MRINRVKVGVVLVATPLIIAACRRDSERVQVHGPGLTTRDSTRVLGPGDIRIISTDSTIELALIGDTVMTGLAAKVLTKVNAETDTGAVAPSGFGASLEKFIKSNVQSALNKQLTFPVASIGEVSFDGGRLELVDPAGKRLASFGGNVSDSTSRSGRFSTSDAQAFVKAFHARKAKSG